MVAKDAMCPYLCRHRLLEGKKNGKYRWLSLRMPQNLYDRTKNCVERVELSFRWERVHLEIFAFEYGHLLAALPDLSFIIPVPHVP